LKVNFPKKFTCCYSNVSKSWFVEAVVVMNFKILVVGLRSLSCLMYKECLKA